MINGYDNPIEYKNGKSLYENDILTGMDLYEFINRFLPLKPLDNRAQKSIYTGQNIIYLQERSTDRKLRECTSFNLKDTPKHPDCENYKRTARLNVKKHVSDEIERYLKIKHISNSDKTRPYSFLFEQVDDLLEVIEVLQNRY